MKTDRELLELAAQAAGYAVIEWVESYGDYYTEDFAGLVIRDGYKNEQRWNPLDDDGDALRLAVKLKMYIETMDKWESSAEDDLGYSKELSRTVVGFEHQELIEPHEQDAYAATRRAIVRAAAAIGEQMK